MNWCWPKKNSVTKIFQPFLPKSELLQSCHPGICMSTCPHAHRVHTDVYYIYIYLCSFHKKLVLNSSHGWRAGMLMNSHLPHFWKVELTECPVSLPPSSWRCRVCRNAKGRKKNKTNTKRQVIPWGVIGQQCLDRSQKIRGREESTE